MTTTSAPDRHGWLSWDDYLRVLRLDATRLKEVARLGLDPPVPSCPGWSVADVLSHTAAVYLHKVECMRRQGAAPQEWPPDGLNDREPLSLFTQASQDLWDELVARDPDEVCATWWPPDQTVGFWYRRMAHETAVHRVDAELAHDVVTPVDAALAVDGIDEVLRVMLGGASWDGKSETSEPIDDRVRVTAAGRSWTVTLREKEVEINASDEGEVSVEVAGQPADVYLWLWGRRDAESLAVTGVDEIAEAFRRRLQEAL